jgi:putative DNA primase/helicase
MFKTEAINYSKQGWAVFPCTSKVPLTPNGFKDASNDPATVESLFAAHPNANIGLVTGKISGIFVVDIDIKNGAGGAESLIELEKRNGLVPPTKESLTWSGGRHLFFKYPEEGVGCRTGIRPGIDIRGDGGYIIAPPSVVNGRPYAWEVSNHPIVEAPDWLLEMLSEKKPDLDMTQPQVFEKGKRNSTLASLAGKMRRLGCDQDQIEQHLLKINQDSCKPPLPERTVRKIAQSISRYPATIAEVKDSKESFNCNLIAEAILKEKTLAFCSDINYEYNGQYFKEKGSDYIKKLIGDKLGHGCTTFKVTEVIAALKRKAYIEVEQVNESPLLNLKNGMFNLDICEVLPHDPAYYSTIQLPVEYLPESQCPIWLNTLNGIFEDKPAEDRKKCIEVIQEFFGLCLTKENKYEKALFLLGEGRNGKSTLLYSVENVLGQANYSAITLEDLVKPNYVAEIFGKLANISIETNAKSSIYDAKFKAIVSGDTLTSDRKYGHPLKFRPFCKMVFALNNMPQVNDKTDAFYKRLIIIRLTRQFSDIEQDRALKEKLLKERNGIFVWMLQGYHRLKQRGYFDPGDNLEAETNEYRKENNSVLSFVDEKCQLSAENVITKDNLYETYKSWCKDSGMMALSKKKFAIQLMKHYGLGKDSRDCHGDRIWQGIGLENGGLKNGYGDNVYG